MAETLAKKTPIFTKPQIRLASHGGTKARPKNDVEDPSGINGKLQPPRKSVTITPEPAIIAAYSPRKKRANPIDEYSV